MTNNSNATREKYFLYLTALKKAKKAIRPEEYRKEHQVGSNLNNFLRTKGILVCTNEGNGTYTFHNPKQSFESLIEDFFKFQKAYIRDYTRRMNKRKQRQLSKRIASVVEAPVHSKMTEEQAIRFLKSSPYYKYEIYRISKEQL